MNLEEKEIKNIMGGIIKLTLFIQMTFSKLKKLEVKKEINSC